MDAVDISIRKVGSSEATTLMKLAKTTFVESFGALNTPSNLEMYLSESFNPKQIERELNNPNSRFYFACQDNEIVGYLKVNHGDAQTDDKLSNALEIERIYVLSSYQGRKIGAQLLKKSIQLARDEHFECVWLGVWDKNIKAIRFYEQHGFTKFGKHPFKLGEDPQTDILMKLEL